MPRLSSFILAFFIGAFFGKVAQAQIVQPTYTRPSKGAALTILNLPASNATTTYAPSAIFDWTAFAGVIVTVNAPTPAPPNTVCKYGVRVKALGGTSTNRSDFFLLNVANNDYKAAISQSWYIRVLPGYLTFNMETYAETANPAVPACTGAYKVTITPLPIDYSGQLVSTGVGTVYGDSGGPTIVEFSASFPYTRLQNIDTSPAVCAPFVNGGYDFLRPAFILKADSTGSTGDGGVIELNNWVGTIHCNGAQVIGLQH